MNLSYWNMRFECPEGKRCIMDQYGIAPAYVFRNDKISIGAKGLYGYLMGFVNGEQAKQGDFRSWPSRNRIMKELNISTNTLTKYLKELQQAKLIDIEQSRVELENGKLGFGNNIYIIKLFIP